MFTKPANEIEFSDVKGFCRAFNEGVRVEYKQQMTKDIPKIVSSFANTLGGIFIIGAETDKKTNKVIAIDGIPNSGGLEEQILQSALTGIYPAVMPEVIILDVPTNPDNVVIIIRVDESPQAPMQFKILREFTSVWRVSHNRMNWQTLTELNICSNAVRIQR